MSRITRRRGSQAVEFALALPLLLTVLAGTVDAGYFFHLQLGMVSAVKEGVLAAAASGDAQTAPGLAQGVAADVWEECGLPGTVVVTSGTDVVNAGGASVTVVWAQGTMAFPALVGFVPMPELQHRAVMAL